MADSSAAGAYRDVNCNEPAIKWKPLSMTFVEYPAGDFIGFVLAWFSMIPIFLLVSFGTLIIFRRDLHTMSYLLGLLLNEVVNWILKHIIRESRPLRDHQILFTEYGMPSSHTQLMFFAASYFVLFVFIRIHRNYHWVDDIWKYGVSIAGFITAIIVAFSRVYLLYHTYSQVICGAIVGMILGGAWFCVVQLVLTPFFPVIASHPIGEFLMLRDSTLIPHVMWFEYTSTRSESRSRQRKVTSRKSQ
ncbi:dolichyldiphosphatase 1-like [Liolophura sinensis]|uniref:dolichyldiphosphatase 1-like n=1 Tax=Liolophura sinensis TaxID=3198878 RepID=UPI00315872E9